MPPQFLTYLSFLVFSVILNLFVCLPSVIFISTKYIFKATSFDGVFHLVAFCCIAFYFIGNDGFVIVVKKISIYLEFFLDDLNTGAELQKLKMQIMWDNL